MTKIYDQQFGKWLKTNKYIIVVREKEKRSKNFLSKFGDNGSLISLPIMSYSKLKFKPKLSTPNVFKLSDNRYNLVHPKLKTCGGRLNRVYREYTTLKTMFGNPSRVSSNPQQNWGKFSESAGNNRAGNAIPCKESAEWINKIPANSKFGFISTNMETYNKRGKTGFDKVPKGIYTYQGGPVFDHSQSPYTGAKVGGILPRPYGPRDQAALKGFPNAKFGNSNLVKAMGYVDQNPLFRPHRTRNWNPGYTSYANKSLYLNGQTPYQNQKNTRTSKGSKFGASLYNSMGPNNLGSRNPMLMYPGAGSNTINWESKKNYLPPYKPDKFYKVQKNNNPTGYLASNVTPIKGLKYGSKKKNKHGTVPLYHMGGVGRPLKLHTSQQQVGEGVEYPEYSDIRNFYGGFGKKKTKRKTSISEGDTLVISKKGIKISKAKTKKR
jgi:hypothetical protein